MNQDTGEVQVTDGYDVGVTSVILDKKSISITKGKTVSLKATVAPSNATDKAVTWKSNNFQIATVTQQGVVTGVKAGTATITVVT